LEILEVIQKCNRYSSSEYKIPDDIYPDEFEIRDDYDDIGIPEYPLSTFKDYKLPRLKKNIPNLISVLILIVCRWRLRLFG
jgi:hypothetical protein